MSRMTDTLQDAHWVGASSRCHAFEVFATLLLLLVCGCASHARIDTASTLPPANPANANQSSAYVTIPLDSTTSEWEFVQWLRAGGVHVEKDANGDDRIVDSPACRAILVRYRRMLRVRFDLISENVANINTTRDAQGAKIPYRRKFLVAYSSGATEIKDDPSPFMVRYMPGSPDADSKGYVHYPNVDLMIEKVDAIVAVKLYRAITQILMHFDPTFVDSYGEEPADVVGVSLSRDADYNQAREQLLSQIIQKFPGVTDAKVVINSDHDKPIPTSTPPSATVVITTADTVEQSKSLVAPAAATVSGAVAGLTLENVSVIINGVSYQTSDSTSP